MFYDYNCFQRHASEPVTFTYVRELIKAIKKDKEARVEYFKALTAFVHDTHKQIKDEQHIAINYTLNEIYEVLAHRAACANSYGDPIF